MITALHWVNIVLAHQLLHSIEKSWTSQETRSVLSGGTWTRPGEERQNTQHKPPKEPQEAGRTHASSSLRRANSFSAWFFFCCFILFFFFYFSSSSVCLWGEESVSVSRRCAFRGKKRGRGKRKRRWGSRKNVRFWCEPAVSRTRTCSTTSQEGYSPCNECAQHEWDRRLCHSKELQKQTCIIWVERKTDFIKPTWEKRRRERHFSH